MRVRSFSLLIQRRRIHSKADMLTSQTIEVESNFEGTDLKLAEFVLKASQHNSHDPQVVAERARGRQIGKVVLNAASCKVERSHRCKRELNGEVNPDKSADAQSFGNDRYRLTS